MMQIHQIYLKGFLKNFAYIIGCEETKKAVVIDPGAASPFLKTKMKKIIRTIQEQQYTVEYIINTHGHSDHINGNGIIKKATNAPVMIHELDIEDKSMVDIPITKEETIRFGNVELQILHTPGHSPGGICLLGESSLFTGDTLFVGDSGTTIFKNSDRKLLGQSLRRVFSYCDDNTVIWPGHHYGKTKTSTIYREKRENVNAKEYGFYVGI